MESKAMHFFLRVFPHFCVAVLFCCASVSQTVNTREAFKDNP
ncbi:hypothetical protein [Aliiglaciecola sp. M165]|nr:hypothetical protein [Aliiglaciecola sp. M165]